MNSHTAIVNVIYWGKKETLQTIQHVHDATSTRHARSHQTLWANVLQILDFTFKRFSILSINYWMGALNLLSVKTGFEILITSTKSVFHLFLLGYILAMYIPWGEKEHWVDKYICTAIGSSLACFRILIRSSTIIEDSQSVKNWINGKKS